MWYGVNSTKYTWVFAGEIVMLEKAAFESFAVRLWYIHSVLFLRAVSNFFPETVFEKNEDHGSGQDMTLVWMLFFVS